MSNVNLQNQLDRNVSNIPGGGGSLGALALLLQIERYNNLEVQVRDEFEDMQKRNDWLKTANSALAALRVNRPADDKAIKDYGTFVDPQGNTQNIHQWMLENGIPIEQNKGDAAGVQSEFDAAISNLKARIDTANSESQISVIHLQSLMDKVNQTVELASNLVAKDGKAKESILGNIR
ncbi:hypothetical protein SAMN04488498_1464 [Mesorhizobium albiziae]|uniref:Uncharacterized protein n=1 Tax=Neomesorhizobium albiziae TaxID=335020 RepID=A0A1I4FG08_9HYPH|nr:hypothetical protein [Mesorhizobium albiziae]GLS33049.1 hypothetical protein GCM10007937_47590 [Mesorhizobium albiziae]SFL16915.1 hypothetical protein SAMN04488498_1464 [Mesorhizobium albiziae]